MKKFHITITENETGKTQLDIDTDAIVAGIDEGDGTRLFHAAKCPCSAHAATLAIVLDSIKEVREANPMIDLLLTLHEGRKDADKETEEN